MPVHNYVLLLETRRTIHETQQLHNATDLLQFPDLFLKRTQAIDHAEPRGRLRHTDVHVAADLPGDRAVRANRPGAGHED